MAKPSITVRMGLTTVLPVLHNRGDVQCRTLLSEAQETLDRDALTAKPAEDWLRRLAEFLRSEASLLPFYVTAVIGSVSYEMSNSILFGLLVDSFGFNTVQLGLMSTLFSLS